MNELEKALNDCKFCPPLVIECEFNQFACEASIIMGENEKMKFKELQLEQPTIIAADSDDEAHAQAKPTVDVSSDKDLLTKSDQQGQNPGQKGSRLQDRENQPQAESNSVNTALPEKELLGLAMHPNTPESEWLKACNELNRREQLPQLPESSAIKRKRIPFAFVLLAIAGCVMAAWCYFSFSHTKAVPPVVSPAKESSALPVKLPAKPTDYMRASSESQKRELNRRARIAVANTIAEKEWTDAEAASNLNLSKQVIADLMEANPVSLSVEDLSQLLTLMGKPANFLAPAKSVQFTFTPPAAQENKDEIAYYTRAIDRGNHKIGLYFNRASAHSYLKEYDLAIADYSRCVEMGDQNALEMRGLVYYQMGNYQAALKDMNTYMSLSPDNDAYQNRALVYDAMGDLPNALKDCTESITRMKTQRPGPYVNRAGIEERLGKLKEALADYEKTVELDPTYTSAIEKVTELKKKL